MNRRIISVLRAFERLIDAYCSIERATDSQLEFELRNEILNSCHDIEILIKELK